MSTNSSACAEKRETDKNSLARRELARQNKGVFVWFILAEDSRKSKLGDRTMAENKNGLYHCLISFIKN